MKCQDPRSTYTVVRSQRTTADLIIERDGRFGRAPQWVDDTQVSVWWSRGSAGSIRALRSGPTWFRFLIASCMAAPVA